MMNYSKASVNTCKIDVISPSNDPLRWNKVENEQAGDRDRLELSMMIFREGKKDYRGSTAVEIVTALESDTRDYPHTGQPLRRFLKWSLHSLSKQIPPRDMHLSKRMNVEELALNYLYLRDEYGAGQLLIDRGAE